MLFVMIIMAVLAFCIALFTFQTKVDFTAKSGCLLVAVIVLLCFGVLSIFVEFVLNLLLPSFLALAFGFYLVFHTHIIMKGQRQYSISPKEYVFTVLVLHGFVAMFMVISSMMRSRRNREYQSSNTHPN